MKVLGCLLIAWIPFLSATAAAGTEESSQIKCGEMGRKFSAEFRKEYVSEISMWGNPEFHYNSALRTCLVFTEVVDGTFQKEIKSVWYYRRVTDIYSNRVLAYSRYVIVKSDPSKKETLVNLGNVGDAVNLTSGKFAAKKTELFRP